METTWAEGGASDEDGSERASEVVVVGRVDSQVASAASWDLIWT